jgi:hypothetical protein
MSRITIKNLEGMVKAVNRVMGTPETAYTRLSDGKLSANVGHYLLDGAYGGWKLSQISNSNGGQRDISSGGYVSKKELYYQIYSYLQGAEDASEFGTTIKN